MFVRYDSSVNEAASSFEAQGGAVEGERHQRFPGRLRCALLPLPSSR